MISSNCRQAEPSSELYGSSVAVKNYYGGVFKTLCHLRCVRSNGFLTRITLFLTIRSFTITGKMKSFAIASVLAAAAYAQQLTFDFDKGKTREELGRKS